MINFLQSINTPKLRMAYNNDVIRFQTSNDSLPVSCTIQDSSNDINVTIYPNPQGEFYFNFKPYVSALINTQNFDDTMEPNIQGDDADSYVYDFTSGTYTQRNITFTVTYDDATTENVSYTLSWLAGVQQPTSIYNFKTDDLLLLSPFKKDSANSHYLKYWQGYPFDIPFYNTSAYVNPLTGKKSLLITNKTNLLSYDFSTTGSCFRAVVSDGRTNVTLEDLLPLTEGFNELVCTTRTLTFVAKEKYLTLEKVPYSCGVYLKWLNAMGGYSYWLFENTYSIDRRTKHIGEIDRDNNNLEDTFARVATLGKDSQDTIRVIAELLNEDERGIVEGILDSPKIYLFTGKPYSQNGHRNWIEVSLKTSSARLKNPRQPLTNFTFDLELPERYTQTL